MTDRFWSKVDHRGPDECWEWHASRDFNGYGRFYTTGRQEDGCRVAHRVAYERSVGPVPDGLELDHLCRNRACVNPAHLEPGSTARRRPIAMAVVATTANGPTPSQPESERRCCSTGSRKQNGQRQHDY